MTNDELIAAWRSKLPAIEPTDRDLSAFALGVEVGADALDAAERERDGANERASQWVRIAGEHGADKDALKSERDALATDARRWRAIDGYWRTAQCYFRKDEKNSIRAMQLHIDFDHPNGRKSLASTIDAALDGAKGAT